METTDELAIAAERLLAPIEAEAAPVEEQTEPESEEAELEAVETVDSEEPDAPPEPVRYRNKIDGEEVDLTLEEMQKLVSASGYVNKKMRENAETRKKLEAEIQAVQTEQRRVLELAQALQQQGIVPPPTLPPAELAQKDPVAYIRAKAQYDAQLQQYQHQQYSIQSVEEQTRAAQESALVAYKQAQAQELQRSIPEFAQPELAEQTRKKLWSIGKEYGYSDQELNGVHDARAVKVLNDAAKWRELQARTAEAKKTPDATRTVKTVARRPEPAQLARSKVVEAAKKSGRLEDWAAAILK